MIPKLLVAWSLMAVCVAIHATGMASVTRWRPGLPATAHRMSPWTWLLIRLAGWIIVSI